MYFACSDIKPPCRMPSMGSRFWWMLQVEALKEKLPDFPARPEEEMFWLLFYVSEYLDVTCTLMLCSVEHLFKSMTLPVVGKGSGH